MNNTLKSQGKAGIGQLIENQLVGARSTPTPLDLAGRFRPARDPRGGLAAPVSLPLSVRPFPVSGHPRTEN